MNRPASELSRQLKRLPRPSWRAGRLLASLLLLLVWGAAGAAAQQDPAGADPASGSNEAKQGYRITVPLPLTSAASGQLIQQLRTLSERSEDTGRRQLVLLDFGDSEGARDGGGTEFEDALKLARAIGGPELRSLRIVAFLRGPVRGHAVLAVLASDQVVVTPAAELGQADANEAEFDPTVEVNYQAIAARRALFAPPVVRAMLDPDAELYRVTKVDGTEAFVDAEQLETLRQEGSILGEERLSGAGQTLRMTGNTLRQTRLASHQVASIDEAADALDIASWADASTAQDAEIESGVLVEITGSITNGRLQRIEANLADPKYNDPGLAWVMAIDSPGGSLIDSLRLASSLSVTDQQQRVAVGWVRNEALGDAVLPALACKPLYVHPEAKLGGPGAQNLTREEIEPLREAIEQIAEATGRPAALIEGLLDAEQTVFRYTDTKTGRVRFATPEQITQESEAGPPGRWQQGAAVDLSRGLSGAQAVQLGLADATADDLESACQAAGLPKVPERLSDRPIIRAVEWLGNRPFLPILLLMIGFMTMSMEVSAPGLGIPGFISLLCFSLFFWMSFLAGTAEWLEVIAFVVGLICILIELFVVPGVGIFGLGGLVLLIGGVVLTTQTFVIPRNPYQLAQMSEALWMVIASCIGLIAGLAMLRWLLPNTPLFWHLHLAAPDMTMSDQREAMVDFTDLIGQQGTSITPLRPAGKARFGDQVLQVVSEGSVIAEGQPIVVIEAIGNRVVVAEDDGSGNLESMTL